MQFLCIAFIQSEPSNNVNTELLWEQKGAVLSMAHRDCATSLDPMPPQNPISVLIFKNESIPPLFLKGGPPCVFSVQSNMFRTAARSLWVATFRPLRNSCPPMATVESMPWTVRWWAGYCAAFLQAQLAVWVLRVALNTLYNVSSLSFSHSSVTVLHKAGSGADQGDCYQLWAESHLWHIC
jgi:hypothetical protein